MDDKAKLYFFTKSEILMIFMFMIGIAVCSFVLGAKMGGELANQRAGITLEDMKNVEMHSNQEEQVQKIIEQESVNENDPALEQLNTDEASQVRQESEDINAQVKKLKEKFEQEIEGQKPLDNSALLGSDEQTKEGAKEVQKEVVIPSVETTKDPLAGKWTIQLGSYDKIVDAEQMAETFKVRGYNPIINEVLLKNKGTWYRVSIGAFENVSQAKDYIIQEKSLFEGQDYVIIPFD